MKMVIMHTVWVAHEQFRRGPVTIASYDLCVQGRPLRCPRRLMTDRKRVHDKDLGLPVIVMSAAADGGATTDNRRMIKVVHY